MKIALYASNHGYGHASRVAAIAKSLIDFGIYVYVCTDRPQFLFQDLPEAAWTYRRISLDVGVVHRDNLRTDLDATKQAIINLFENREELVGNEILFLKEQGIDLVVADIPYLIVEACLYSRIPIVGISNFDWYFIYKDLFKDDLDMQPILNTIWALYQRMNRTYLPGLGDESSVPGFRRMKRLSLIAKSKPSYPEIRHKYGILETEKILLIMFGGEGMIDIPIEKICKAWDGKVLIPFKGYDAPNLVQVNPDDDFQSLIHAAELILCKPGYSSFAEIMCMGKAMIYIPRQNYPEERVLIDGASDYSSGLLAERIPDDVGEIRELFAKVPRTAEPRENQSRDLAGMLIQDYLDYKYPGDRILSVYDLGSNNMNYLLFNKSANRVIHRHWCTTGLGMYLQDGKFSDTGIQNTLWELNPIMEADAQILSEKKLIATGVNRKAVNATELMDAIESRWQIMSKIISAYQEMKYGWRAASTYKLRGYDNLVIDIGGASTELSWAGRNNVQTGTSLDFGLLSLLQAESNGYSIRDQVQKAFAGLPIFSEVQIIAVGLTATVLIRYSRGLSIAESLTMSGSRISLQELTNMIDRIDNREIEQPEDRDPDEREIRTLRIAAIVLQLLLDRYQSSDFVVCNDGINIGYAQWIK